MRLKGALCEQKFVQSVYQWANVILSEKKIDLILHPGRVGHNGPGDFYFCERRPVLRQPDGCSHHWNLSQVPHLLNHPECHLSHAAAAWLETLRDLHLSSVSLFISCVIRFSPIFPPLWASAGAVPMWVCCHLLAKSCGIWGCKVDMCGMAPRTLYDQPNSKHVLLPLCQLLVILLIGLCQSLMRLCPAECDRQQGNSKAASSTKPLTKASQLQTFQPVKPSWLLEVG